MLMEFQKISGIQGKNYQYNAHTLSTPSVSMGQLFRILFLLFYYNVMGNITDLSRHIYV